MNKTVRFLLLALALAMGSTSTAAAHPLGNFSVNRYSRIEVGRDDVRLRYVLDLAEIPTLQELLAPGARRAKSEDGARELLLTAKTMELAEGARLTLGGHPVAWSVEEARLEFLPGQAGLDTMRVELTMSAPIEALDGARVKYRDLNYPGRTGWHEIILRGTGGVSLADSSVPPEDTSDELRAYPVEATRSPLNVSAAVGTVRRHADPNGTRADLRSAAEIASRLQSAARFAVDPTVDALASLLRNGSEASSVSLFLALAIAVGLGGMHALEPGHGKALVGGYLVGSRGNVRHAVLLGLTVTATHTAGVYALGLISLLAAQYVLPEQLYPLLSIASGLLLFGVGASLVRLHLRSLMSIWTRRQHAGTAETGHHHECGASRLESHHLAHGHSHQHSYGRGTHAHPHDNLGVGAPTIGSVLAMGVSGGLLPCPAALVVLLAAISFHNVGLGMTLVAAFSVGLASVLTGIGLLVVGGRHALQRSSAWARLGNSPALRAAPGASALAISIGGLAIAAQGARALI